MCQRKAPTESFWLDILESEESVEASSRLPTGRFDGWHVVMMNVRENAWKELLGNAWLCTGERKLEWKFENIVEKSDYKMKNLAKLTKH